jgi:hypothetical protein
MTMRGARDSGACAWLAAGDEGYLDGWRTEAFKPLSLLLVLRVAGG